MEKFKWLFVSWRIWYDVAVNRRIKKIKNYWHSFINKGFYTSLTFMINLWNEPLAIFSNFVWNYHKCKDSVYQSTVLSKVSPLKNFNVFQQITWPSQERRNGFTGKSPSIKLCVVIRFLWHDVTSLNISDAIW